VPYYEAIGFGETPSILRKLATCREFSLLSKDEADALLAKKELYLSEVRTRGRLRETFLHGAGGAPATTYTGRDQMALNRQRCTLLTHGGREQEMIEEAKKQEDEEAAIALVKENKLKAAAKVVEDKKKNGG
jgi:hypothetical protein